MEDVAAAVIDIGAYSTKAGFAGDDGPRAFFRSVVGRPQMPGIMVGLDQKDAYIGEEAIEKRGILNCKEPMKFRSIQDWEDLEKLIFHTCYNALKIVPEQHPILMSEPPLTPPATRAKLAELMFENFSAPAYFSCISGVLGLFSTGYTTGMVVDAGEGATHTLPVYEGYASIHAINRLDVSGEFLTFHLRDMLADRGYAFTTPMEIDIVRNIKETECYIAEDFEHETKLAEEQDASNKFYELPDGNTILIGYERFRCPEALFEPQLLGIEDDGLHHKLYQSVMKSDQEIRRELYSNIVLLGGSTLFPGLKERLYATVKNLAPVGTVPEVKDSPERLYSTWIGGSVLASLSTFSKMSIERHEYYEKGPDRDLFVQRKFFC